MIDRRRVLVSGTSMALALVAAPVWAAASGPVQLIMVVQRGCIYCAAWRREVGPGYGASRAGRVVPILEVDINGPWPDGLALARNPHLTPTFILVRGGLELGRIEGYPGPQPFYAELAQMLKDAGIRAI